MAWVHSKKERIGGQVAWRRLNHQIDAFAAKVKRDLDAQVKIFTKEEIENFVRERNKHGK